MKDYFLRDGLKLKNFGLIKKARSAQKYSIMKIILNPMKLIFDKIDTRFKIREISQLLEKIKNIQNVYQNK